jgi:hypothetical protein
MRMLAVCSTLSIVLLALLAAGCHYSTAHFTDVAMSRTVGEKHEPGKRVTSFQKSDAEIHCCAFVANTPEGTEVKAVWKLKGEQAMSVLDSTEIVVDGDSWVDFFLRKPPDGSFPYASYAVDLSINGAFQQTVAFRVEPQFTGGPVREALLAESVDANFYPGLRASEFPVNGDGVYASVYAIPAGSHAVITARWYAGDVEGTQPLLSTDYPIDGEAPVWVAFSFTPHGSLPAGEYHADILQDGTLVTALPFTLR